MALPRTEHIKETVSLSGGEVEVRGLSRSEALTVAELGDDIQAVEKAVIQYATGTPAKDVDQWYSEAGNDDVEAVVNAVLRLSGMDPESGKGSSAS